MSVLAEQTNLTVTLSEITLVAEMVSEFYCRGVTYKSAKIVKIRAGLQVGELVSL